MKGAREDGVVPVSMSVIVARSQDPRENAPVGESHARGPADIGLNFFISHIGEGASRPPRVSPAQARHAGREGAGGNRMANRMKNHHGEMAERLKAAVC